MRTHPIDTLTLTLDATSSIRMKSKSGESDLTLHGPLKILLQGPIEIDGVVQADLVVAANMIIDHMNR